MRKVPITTEYIKLDALLKYTGVCGTGGEAKAVIQEGMVTVNGEVCTQRGKKLVKGDKIQFDEEEIEVIAK
ncbi:MAG: RNA-binding S4 domain-containing protein [Oscillospiraceae bacterium]|nr:RNA-binding S4 domain-containing protein [Oscillospiraceae bacterium]